MDASGEERIATLSTDELRQEVARLQSLLVDEEEEDEAEAQLDDEELQNSNEEGGPFSWVEDTTLKYTNGDVYKGEAVENIRNGTGTHQCSSGDFYEGQWKDDKRHGKGKLTYVSGLQYEGDWVDDKAQGQGTCLYANGDKYEGEWKRDHRWGWGILSFANGDVYEGEWVDDIMEGSGRYSYKDKSYYQGQYLNGSRSKGKFCSADGGIEYDGQWKGNARHGSGTFHLSGIYKYNGNWMDDMRHGQGKCVYADGSVYDGDWKSDERDGHGKFQSKDDVYEGNWKHNVKDGYGTSKFASGGRYQGQWKMGAEEGNGKRLYPDGSVYEGQWLKGKRHGKGKCTMASKELYQGEWESDMRHGYGVCTYADGSKYRGEWEEDCWLQSTADPAFTKVFGPGLSRGIAGEATMFGIEARDELKNKRMNGGDEFHVRFENNDTKEVAFAEVTDNDDGSYAVKFCTTVAGMYTCSVMIGADEHVADSPYPVRILPGRPFPRCCEITGEGHRFAVTHNSASFFVEAFDRSGNAVHGFISEHLPLKVSVSSNNVEIDDVEVTDTGHGRYKVAYTPSQKGFYRVVVESGGIHIGDSPYSLQVRAAESLEEKTVDDVVPCPPPTDQVTQWEEIALKEYMLDGDQGGWESDDEEDQETAEEKCIRENPGVPVITNLEDLYKLPRLQKVAAEEQRKKKAAKLASLRRRLEAEEAAHGFRELDGAYGQKKSDASSSIADLD